MGLRGGLASPDVFFIVLIAVRFLVMWLAV